MKKFFNVMLIAFVFIATSCNNQKHEVEENEEEVECDNPQARAEQEFKKTVDPALGIVPTERLYAAMEQAHQQQGLYTLDGGTTPWIERGPLYDSVTTGNSRGQASGSAPRTYTSGRIKAFMVDISDPTGNTVFCGGVAGGIWKCTNFLSTTAIPDWKPIGDYLSNLTILSICQNPINSDVMYVCTGEPNYITNSPRGNGIYKSIDHGATWTVLSSTTGKKYGYKILCDAAGNVYHATFSNGLLRSTNGGSTWTTITPTGVSAQCTDIEISRTGKMHASFGDYNTGAAISYRYTANPATVTTGTWSSATLPLGASPGRLELAVAGDTIYGATFSKSTYNIDFAFRSVNGGATWTKLNSTAFTSSSLTNTQGWYTLSLGVNPSNPEEILLGCLNVMKSTDGGATFSDVSAWVGTGQYVHADIHSFTWWVNSAGESKLVVGCDGGLFLSENDGINWRDRNRNLGLKQFYACAIHPTTVGYYLAGAQDNGTHQFKYPTTVSSRECIGGDGGYCAIDQDQPTYQFGTYVYQMFRRSTNGGSTWSQVNISSSLGDFINPWAYDDVQNIILAGSGSGNFMRWTNPQSGTTTSTVTLSELGGMVGCIKISPYTTGTAFLGSQSGQIIKLTNTKTTTGSGSADVTDITPPGANGYCSDIAVGSDENNLAAVYSSYGVNQIWVTTDGGTNWTAIDGNFPDIPARSIVFSPYTNGSIIVGSELGVYYTNTINGASTQWILSTGLPLAPVYMMKIKKNTGELFAATFGRGLWSANIPDILPLIKITLNGSLIGDNTANLNWQMIDASTNAKYSLQYSTDGINFTNIAKGGNELHNYKQQLTAEKGYFRVVGFEPNSSPIFSNIIVIKSGRNIKGLQINVAPNPLTNNGKITITAPTAGEYNWQICNVQGSVLHIGRGNLNAGLVESLNFNASRIGSGFYIIRVTQNGVTKSSTFIKQ